MLFIISYRYTKYKIGYDLNGKILGIIANLYCDSGNSPNDNAMPVASSFLDNTYNCKNWSIICELAKTNLPANTAVRSKMTYLFKELP